MPGMTQSGAVWSDGSQPYLYMGAMKAYSKMPSDALALSSATGISGGAAFTIPSLFLAMFHDPFARLKDPRLQTSEKVAGEDCYVVSGTSTVSKKETFWISKSKHLIVKYSRSLERVEGETVVPEMTADQVDQALQSTGQTVTEETRKGMRDMMDQSNAVLKSMKMKGSSTETHLHIESPQLSQADFLFTPPGNAVLKESLFDGALKGGQ